MEHLRLNTLTDIKTSILTPRGDYEHPALFIWESPPGREQASNLPKWRIAKVLELQAMRFARRLLRVRAKRSNVLGGVRRNTRPL